MQLQRRSLLVRCAAELLDLSTTCSWTVAKPGWPCWLAPQGAAALHVHGHTAKERRDFPTQLARLDSVRGVLRLAGTDLLHFLQVCSQNVFPDRHLLFLAGLLASIFPQSLQAYCLAIYSINHLCQPHCVLPFSKPSFVVRHVVKDREFCVKSRACKIGEHVFALAGHNDE